MLKNYIYLIIIILAFNAISCHHQQNRYGAYAGTNGYNAADSIMSVYGDARDWPRVLELCDSFEQSGDISKVKGIFYRTIAYNILGQYRTSLNLYYQLAEIDMKELTTQADVESYTYAYKDYVRLLCDMRRYDRALRQAHLADQKLKAAGHPSFIDHHDIAQMIGECQLFLGQRKAAAESFKRALNGVRERLKTNNDPLDLRECQKTMNAIATVYMRSTDYDKVTPWIAYEDSLYAVAQTHPKRDSVYIDEMKGDICYIKAMQALATGQPAKAEQFFAQYNSTKMAKQPANIINSNRYLMASHRYEEAVRNYIQLDKFMDESGYEADLENIGRFMVPKFHVNMLAGHRDSALRVATQICGIYDSALVRQKRIDADLISTIYDTEGKERQIAEQKARMSRQQLVAVMVILLIIVIFFHVYMMQRRRAYRKLDETNRQLMMANERAEESNRMKAKFIKQISHEVRTPLNVLSGFTQVLAAPDIEISGDELQSISQKIVENSERITHLVDKMLVLSEVNINTAIECKDTAYPTDIANMAVKQSDILKATHLNFMMQSTQEANTISFTTNVKSTVKALSLILDNAMKFTHPLALHGKAHTDKARVTMNVSVADGQVAYAIEDTGIGIPPEQAENIFTEFVQLDEYSEGTGIGLSVARSLVRHMGGDITLDTSYTDGARFVVTLPCRNSANDDILADSQSK